MFSGSADPTIRYRCVAVRMKMDRGDGHRRQRRAVERVDREPIAVRPGADHRRPAVLVEEVEAAVGEDRRRGEAGAEALLPADGAGSRVEARRDAVVGDDVELVADEERRRRQRRAARQRPGDMRFVTSPLPSGRTASSDGCWKPVVMNTSPAP